MKLIPASFTKIKRRTWYLISFAGIIALIAITDQLTKSYIAHHFVLGEVKVVIPHLFNITYIVNQGAAFGMMATETAWWRSIMLLWVPLAVCLWLMILLWQARRQPIIFGISYSLILGGAIGNLIDRICDGRVIDFIQVHWQEHYFPAFNVADSAISICPGISSSSSGREAKNSNQTRASFLDIFMKIPPIRGCGTIRLS